MNKRRLIAGLLVCATLPLWMYVLMPAITLFLKPNAYHLVQDGWEDFWQEKTRDWTKKYEKLERQDETESMESGISIMKSDYKGISADGIATLENSSKYAVDRSTGRNAASAGLESRAGYFEFPQHVEQISYLFHSPFVVEEPAQALFDGKDVVDGLAVYRFRYAIPFRDKTKFFPSALLQAISGTVILGNHTGILFVEPVSGHVVRYEHQGENILADGKTGERLQNFQRWFNATTRESQAENVSIAAEQKLLIRLVEWGGTGLLILLCACLLLFGRRNGPLSNQLLRQRGGRQTRKWSLTVWWIFIAAGICMVIVIAYSALFTGLFRILSQGDAKRIGILYWIPPGNPAYDNTVQGFKDALSQAGFHDGKEVIYDLQSAQTDPARQRQIIEEFKRQNMDLLFSLTTPGTLIVKEMVRDTPVVFSIVLYPVETGIVPTLTHAPSNFVGTRPWVRPADQLALFHELVPAFSSMGFVHRKGEPNSEVQFEEMKKAGEILGIKVIDIASTRLEEVQPMLDLHRADIDALYASCDTLIQTGAGDILTSFAHKHSLPSFSCYEEGVKRGDLMAVFADFYEVGVLAGEKAVRILEGASPASLETSTVARPFIIVNKKTADALGIVIPQSLLARAKEIIQ